MKKNRIRLQLCNAIPSPRTTRVCVPMTDITDQYVALARAFGRLLRPAQVSR